MDESKTFVKHLKAYLIYLSCLTGVSNAILFGKNFVHICASTKTRHDGLCTEVKTCYVNKLASKQHTERRKNLLVKQTLLTQCGNFIFIEWPYNRKDFFLKE